MINTDLSNDTGFGAGYGSVVYTLPGESIGGAGWCRSHSFKGTIFLLEQVFFYSIISFISNMLSGLGTSSASIMLGSMWNCIYHLDFLYSYKPIEYVVLF